MKPNIIILGAGGTGAPIGALLSKAGLDPVFLLNPVRAFDVREQGLRISWNGALATYHPRVICGGEAVPHADLLIVSCKQQDLPGAIQSIAPYVKAGTAILPIQNGVDHMVPLMRRFPEAELWGGVACLGAEKRFETVHLFTEHNKLVVGGFSGPPNQMLVAALRSAFRGSVLDLVVHDRIRTAMWSKYIYICALAGATLLTNADTGRILAARFGSVLLSDLFQECEGIVAASGDTFDADFLADLRDETLNPAGASTSSLLRDMRAGRLNRLEAGLLEGMQGRARACGFSAPTLDLVMSSLALKCAPAAFA